MDKGLSKRDVNKLRNIEMIISSAEKLFLQKEFENTSMDDISKEANLTIRTIYKYFKSKEDLFFAVALKGAKQMNELCEESFMNAKNALEKIRLTNKAYCQFYINNPGMFKLMNYQPDNKLNCEVSKSFHELSIYKEKTLNRYMKIVGEGKSDGSINLNLDPKKAVYFGLLSSIGLLNMVSEMGGSYFWQREGLDEIEFLYFSMDLLADALK